jgi:hypothetical protein
MAFMRAQCSDVLLFVSTNSRGNAPQAKGKGQERCLCRFCLLANMKKSVLLKYLRTKVEEVPGYEGVQVL